MRSLVVTIIATCGIIWIWAFCMHLWPSPTGQFWYAIPTTMSIALVWCIIIISIDSLFKKKQNND